MIVPNRRQPSALVLAVILALVLGACGADDDDELGAAAPSADSTAPSSSETTTDEAPADAASAGTVSFTEADMITACLDEPATEDLAPDEPGILADAEGFRYCVGPGVQIGIESVGAVAGPVGPAIEPVMTEAGIETFNLLAGECFEPEAGNSPCPTGQLAIVADGRVLSAPTINAPSFARDQIVIAGSFTIEEAEVIADAMAAEQQLLVRPVLLNLGPDGP